MMPCPWCRVKINHAKTDNFLCGEGESPGHKGRTGVAFLLQLLHRSLLDRLLVPALYEQIHHGEDHDCEGNDYDSRP